LPAAKQVPVEGQSLGLFASAEKRKAIVCLLLAVVTLALYNPVNRYPFVNYDDDRYVTENPHVRQGLTLNTIAWALTSTEQANWHPITWLSHALDCSLYGLNPTGHHFISVLLHAVNVALLFLLLMWATGRLGPSLFVAALFAIHPINVESVAWVAERKNVLCTTFFFLALWAYGWYAQKPSWKRYLAVAALFVAGLASKPMVITLPFVLLLLDYWPLRRVQSERGRGYKSGSFPWRNLGLEKLPLLAISASSAVITMGAQRSGGAMRSMEQFPFGVRLANVVNAYLMYLWKMIWPSRLAPLYPHPGASLPGWQVALAALVLIAITAFVIRFRAHHYLLVGWLWYLGTLVPVLGLVQVGDAAMADRYAYIPLIGIFIMIAFGAAESAENYRLSYLATIGGTAVLIVLAFTAHHQITYWQSSETLWSHTLDVTRNNFIAEDNLGGALIMEGREEDAYPHFLAAARINPRDPMSRSNLGTYLQSHHRSQEAIAQYKIAVGLTSDSGLLAQTYANLGAAYRALGDDESAQHNFEQSLRLNPDQFNAWLGLGALAEKQGKIDLAISNFSHSIEAQPTAQGYFELGNALAQAGRSPQAVEAYQQALKISPDFADAQHALDTLQRGPR
jgi:protein O-mannosyl-transferase